MLSIFLQILICGIATSAICRTIAYYDGPFHIFPRIRNSLLPKSKIFMRTYEINDIQDLKDQYSDIVMNDQEAEGEFELWKTYHTLYNHKFYHSFKGTLYGILECPFCLGPYVSLVMAGLSTIFVMLLEPIGWHNLVSYFLVASGSYGLHFIISKRWEPLNNV